MSSIVPPRGNANSPFLPFILALNLNNNSQRREMEIRPVSIHVAHTMWYDAHVSQATELQESALRVGSDKLGKRSI